MNLSKNGFWSKAYHAAREARNTFFHKEPWYQDPYHDLDRTDLCTFVRSIFVTAPIILAINAIVATALLGSIVLIAKGLFVNVWTVAAIMGVLGAAAIIIGIIFFLGVGIAEGYFVVRKSETALLLKARILSKKQNFCPTISFTETPDARS